MGSTTAKPILGGGSFLRHALLRWSFLKMSVCGPDKEGHWDGLITD